MLLWAVLACTSTVDNATDFAIPDVNETSPRSGELVSPGDYAGEVSAWYFGHAT